MSLGCSPGHSGGVQAGLLAAALARLAAGLGIAEQFLDPVPALLHPVQRQAEIGDGIAHRVICRLAGQPDQHGPVLRHGAQAAPGQFREQLAGAVLDLDDQYLACLGEAGDRVGAQQLAAVDGHDVVADLLQLAEQVRRDQDGDAEIGTDPADQLKHRGPAGGVEADGRLVEQQQARVADQRLG